MPLFPPLLAARTCIFEGVGQRGTVPVGGAGVAAGVGAPSVCIITRNQTGQYGLSRSTLEEYAAPGDTGDAARDL